MRHAGVDVILPDTRWLQARSEDLAAVIVTHGHEDHLVGSHLLKQFEVPLYGSELTMALARQKVIEARLEDRLRFTRLGWTTTQDWAIRHRGAANHPLGS